MAYKFSADSDRMEDARGMLGLDSGVSSRSINQDSDHRDEGCHKSAHGISQGPNEVSSVLRPGP